MAINPWIRNSALRKMADRLNSASDLAYIKNREYAAVALTDPELAAELEQACMDELVLAVSSPESLTQQSDTV